MGDTSDEGRPNGDYSQRENHLWENRSVHSEEEGPFGVFGHVSRTNLDWRVSLKVHDLVDR